MARWVTQTPLAHTTARNSCILRARVLTYYINMYGCAPPESRFAQELGDTTAGKHLRAALKKRVQVGSHMVVCTPTDVAFTQQYMWPKNSTRTSTLHIVYQSIVYSL